MVIDTTYFSYGAGLVMTGFICGLIFSVVLSVIRKGQQVL